MRFLVDECAGPKVAQWLNEQNHVVFSVYEQARGMLDDDIIEKAYIEKDAYKKVLFYYDLKMKEQLSRLRQSDDYWKDMLIN